MWSFLLAAVMGFGLRMPLPSADAILSAQEREAHEAAVARRIEWQIARQEKPREAPKPKPRKLSERERRDLVRALDRYHGPMPIFWTPLAR